MHLPGHARRHVTHLMTITSWKLILVLVCTHCPPLVSVPILFLSFCSFNCILSLYDGLVKGSDLRVAFFHLAAFGLYCCYASGLMVLCSWFSRHHRVLILYPYPLLSFSINLLQCLLHMCCLNSLNPRQAMLQLFDLEFPYFLYTALDLRYITGLVLQSNSSCFTNPVAYLLAVNPVLPFWLTPPPLTPPSHRGVAPKILELC
jgi:hypothetical protein